MAFYNKFRLKNATKNEYNYVWAEETSPEPTQSYEYPSDNIDTNHTVVVESGNFDTNPMLADTFAAKKEKRIKDVDIRTGELISQGFIYNGLAFSLSSLAQTNWIGMKQADQNNLITYPFGVSTKGDDEYFLVDKTDVTNFYIAGLGTKMAHLSSGRSLKQDLKATTTQAELDAVQDNR